MNINVLHHQLPALAHKGASILYYNKYGKLCLEEKFFEQVNAVKCQGRDHQGLPVIGPVNQK